MTHSHPLPDIDLLVLDLDGTVRTCTVPGQPCPNRPGEQALVPGIGETLAAYQQAGIPIAIATNQGGIGMGFMTERAFQKQLVELREMLQSPTLDASFPVLHCPHHPRSGCACRKPKGGMLFKLMGRFAVPRERTLYVGDRSPDKGAADAAGCRFMWAWDFHAWDGYPARHRR